MKGTDVTPWQLKHAEAFVRQVERGPNTGADEFVMERSRLIQLLAWYGAIRAEGARNGIAEGQGEIYSKRKGKRR